MASPLIAQPHLAQPPQLAQQMAAPPTQQLPQQDFAAIQQQAAALPPVQTPEDDYRAMVDLITQRAQQRQAPIAREELADALEVLAEQQPARIKTYRGRQQGEVRRYFYDNPVPGSVQVGDQYVTERPYYTPQEQADRMLARSVVSRWAEMNRGIEPLAARTLESQERQGLVGQLADVLRGQTTGQLGRQELGLRGQELRDQRSRTRQQMDIEARALQLDEMQRQDAMLQAYGLQPNMPSVAAGGPSMDFFTALKGIADIPALVRLFNNPSLTIEQKAAINRRIWELQHPVE